MGKFYDFIADNILSLLSVVIGIIVLIMQGLGKLGTPEVASATLAIVALLATSEVVERQRRLNKLEKAIEKNTEQFQGGFDSYIIKKMQPPESWEYMRFKIATAQKSIHWTSIGSRLSSPSSTKRPYEDLFDQVAQEGKVKIRWLATLESETRKKRAEKIIFTKKDNSNSLVRYVPDPGNFPHMSIMIIDENEVLVRPPLKEGGRSYLMAIKSLEVSRLFMDYFDQLWESGVALDKSEKTLQFLRKGTDNTK